MLPAERQERIVDFVNKAGFISITKLIELLQVSKPTIMRDLSKLEQQQKLIRTYGGAASLKRGTRFETRHAVKEEHEITKKRQIAALAKQMIHPGETILLDSGSTTLALAKELMMIKNVTILTNDIKIAMVLCSNDAIELVMLGGYRRRGVYSLVGPLTEHMLDILNVDKAFLGTDAIDLKRGLTNSNIYEQGIKQKMIAAGKETFLLADSTKFQKVAFSKMSTIDIFDHVITDDGLTDDELIQSIQERGINLQIAN